MVQAKDPIKLFVGNLLAYLSAEKWTEWYLSEIKINFENVSIQGRLETRCNDRFPDDSAEISMVHNNMKYLIYLINCHIL
jgi:hypothetical protein